MILCTDESIHNVVRSTIRRYGNKVSLNHLDVSRVTNMAALFKCTQYVGDISRWDVRNVTNTSKMFARSLFNGDLSK